MNILVIGSGGREHAICHAFANSSRLMKLYCAEGNGGIEGLAELVNIKPDQIEELANFALSNRIDLTFVGGEVPLALGIVDEFESRGLKIIGPSKAAARLEASKVFSKDFMRRHSIPTAAYQTAQSTDEAVAILESGVFGDVDSPVVVKADGLAAGKGVVVAPDRISAIEAIGAMNELAGDAAANQIVLEECVFGKEISLLMFCDGENFSLMPATRDHKRIGEGDTGPNTGGMGAITDDGLLTSQQTETIINTIIKPTLAGCVAEGFPFRGILFLGLMMTENGPSLLEYNVRFGDPETQAILVRLETDLVEICEAMLDGSLDKHFIRWRKGSSACIVLASENYPAKPRTGDVIRGIDNAAVTDLCIFHAGTARKENEFVTSGGRVLGVTAVADDLETALAWAYNGVGKISWPGMQYRRDIGK